MEKTEKELEVTPGVNENEETTQKTDDKVADVLTKKHLEEALKKIVDEKLELAATAEDNIDYEVQDEEPQEKKGLGLFPMLLIGGVVVVGAATLFLRNRPNSHPIEAETENQG